MILRMFVLGWILLIGAIFINFIAIKLGIETWYSFLNNMGKYGFIKAISSASFVSKLFLFVLYPLFFGVLMFVLSKFK